MNKCLFPSYSSIEFTVRSPKFVTGSERLKNRDKSRNITLLTNYRFEDVGVADQTACIVQIVFTTK